MAENTLISSFKNSAGEQVRICQTNDTGTDLIDVRVYYVVDSPEEEWRPTRKGICMQREQTKSLLEGLKLAFKQINEK